MSALIVLGFDVTHAVKTLVDFKPRRACIVIGSINGVVDPRSLNAFVPLTQIATAMNISVERLDVEVLNFREAVEKIESKLFELASTPPIYVDLGGGLRLLVLETFLAVQRFWRRSRIAEIHFVIYVEGSNRRTEISANELENILSGSVKIELPDLHQKVLSVLSTEYEMRLAEIYRRLIEQGVKISRQYLATVLRKLEEMGLVKRVSRGKYIKLPVAP